MVHWTLGDSLGEQRARAVVDGMVTPLDFTAFAIPPSDGIVTVFSGDSLIGLAGPAANLALALIAFVIIKALLASGTFQIPSSDFNLFSHLVEPAGQVATRSPLGAVAMLLSVMLSLNVLLALFNLMPVLPLDGASVLQGLFPNSVGRLYDSMRTMPMIELLGLLVVWNLFPRISEPAFALLLRLVYT